MTMVAAEAAGTRGAAVSRDKLISTPRSGARPLGNSPGPSDSPPARPAPSRASSGTAARTEPRPAPAPRPARAASPGRQGAAGPQGPSGSRGKPGRSPLDTTRQATRSARQFSSPEFHNYQGIILAEFVLAELLVAATPIATRQPSPGSEKLSPYIPRDMTKMLSIGLLYFLLELSAVGSSKWGRVSAWFGGLILIAVGLNEAANVSRVLNLFGGSNSGPQAPADTGTTGNGPVQGSTTNPPQAAQTGSTGSEIKPWG